MIIEMRLFLGYFSTFPEGNMVYLFWSFNSTMKAVSQFYGRRQVEELKGPPRTFRIGKHLKDLWEKIPPGDLELRLFTSLYAQEKKQRAKMKSYCKI